MQLHYTGSSLMMSRMVCICVTSVDKHPPSCITFTAVQGMEHALWMHLHNNAPCICIPQAAVIDRNSPTSLMVLVELL